MHVLRNWLAGLLLVWSFPLFAVMAFQQDLELPSGNEVQANVYGQSGNPRVVWIGPGYELHDRHRQVAGDLAALGLQVWQIDLSEALFLPRGAESMRDIPARVVAELIEAISEGGKHRLLLISGSYGAIPTLRGIHAWQMTQPTQRTIIGAILFSPNLFTHVPELGAEPSFVEVTRATSVPVYIFQSEKNSNRWHLPDMSKQLQLHAPVYTEIMPGVTSLFYKGDKAKPTVQRIKTIAAKIKSLVPLLSSHTYPLQAVQLSTDKPIENKLGLNDRLNPYQGTVQPQAFSLKDVHGKTYTETDFSGKVSVINFWASWCPPCVEEIPSLNRLRKKMQGKPFQLISINYAESAQSIKRFMKKVAVDFPVLIDPDGKTTRSWRVVAFPSTFVIGPDGKIKYGVNAAIHWDTPEVITQIEGLMK